MKHSISPKITTAVAALLMLLSFTGCSVQVAEQTPAVQLAEPASQSAIPTNPEQEESVEPTQIPTEETTERVAEETMAHEFEIPTENEIIEETEEIPSTGSAEREENEVISSTSEKEPDTPAKPSIPDNAGIAAPTPEENTELPTAEPTQPPIDSGDKTIEELIVERWKAFALETKELTLYVGDTYKIGFTYPGDVSKMEWRSENPDIIAVDNTGCITALAEGKGKIVVFTADYGARQCAVTVLPKPLRADEKDQAARKVAQEIAYIIMNDPTITTDIERIAYAARFVNAYVAMGHTSSFHEDCRTAYGTFVAGYSNCVGSTKATGLVLEYMGYSWHHVNQNTWGHQWCEVYGVDGQTAFCDGSVYGIVGFGQRHEDGGNWLYMTNEGQLVSFNGYFN